MALVSKVALKIAKFTAGTEHVTKRQSKQVAAELQKVISGKSRGEKKKLIKEMSKLTNESKSAETADKNIRQAIEQRLEDFDDSTVRRIRCGLTPVKPFKSLSAKEEKIVNGFYDAKAVYQSVTTQIRTRKLSNNISKIITGAVDDMRKSMRASVPEIINSEKIPKIVKEVQEDMIYDAKIIAGRFFKYPVTKLRSLFVPPGVRKIFTELAHLPKDKFGEKYYEYLLKTKGLSGRAPAKIVVTDKSAGVNPLEFFLSDCARRHLPKCQGGFSPSFNTIEYTREFASLPRAIQANLLTHELKHFEQADTIIRTFGIERYIKGQKALSFKNLKAAYPEKSEAEMKEMVETAFEKEGLTEKIRTAFKSSSDAPKISPDSKEGKAALKYLEAMEGYTGVKRSGPFGMFTEVSEGYRKNPLEVEAYSVGNKAGRLFKIFENLNLREV